MKVIALMIGKSSSSGVPGKNISYVLNHRLCEYGLMAAQESKYVDNVYISTDCPVIAKVGESYGAKIIQRPSELHDPNTLTEDVLSHAHEIITKEQTKEFTYYVLLYANGGFINGPMLDQAIEKMEKKPEFDSCVGAVNADMFTPIRAKKITSEDEIVPFIDLDIFGDITSNRDSAGSVFFIDLSLQVIRPYCFDTMDGNQRPFMWLGKKIMPFKKDFGGDLDATWQYPVLESWLKENAPKG